MTFYERQYTLLKAYINNPVNQKYFPRCVEARKRELMEIHKKIYPNEAASNN